MDKTGRFIPHNKINSEVWRAALYVRLSDEDRNKKNKADFSLSIKNQISFLKAYTDKNNQEGTERKIEIHEVYSDDDLTGMNFDRAGFRRMMYAVESGLVDCIIVKSLSRFGRYDTGMLEYMERTFERTGKEVRFIALSDNYDSLYDELDMLTKIKVLINREYSEIQHKNVSIAMHSMQMEGLYVGAFAPYGYEKDSHNKNKLVIDIYAAEIVRRIFREYLSGRTPKEIACGLTRDGVLNRTAYKRAKGSNYTCAGKISASEVHWTSDAIKQILMNEVYTGTMVQGKTVKRRLIDTAPTVVPKESWVRVQNRHEAIVAGEDWQLAQSMMKSIKRDMNCRDEVTIFKGILKCGDCGHAMRKRWDKYQCKKDGAVNKYLYYNCSTYRDFTKRAGKEDWMPACSGHYISDKTIRQAVLNDLNVMISQVQNLAEVVNDRWRKRNQSVDYRRGKEEIALRRKAILTNEKRLKAARNKWLDGRLEDEEYTAVKRELEKENRTYEGQIEVLQKGMLKSEQMPENTWLRELLRVGKITELDRETVIHLIDRIAIFEDGHIEIEYKFSKEYDALFQRTI